MMTSGVMRADIDDDTDDDSQCDERNGDKHYYQLIITTIATMTTITTITTSTTITTITILTIILVVNLTTDKSQHKSDSKEESQGKHSLGAPTLTMRW